MMTDNIQSSPATFRTFGEGLVSWGDFAIGYSVDVRVETCQPVQPSSNDFLLWKDMVEEPWKYGDDIGDWLDLDAKLRVSAGRWRLDAYWTEVERRQNWDRLETMLWKAWDDYLVRKEKKVVLIQALWRGHSARKQMVWKDCCMCLAHRISPIKTDVGFMCKECSRDGPFADLIGMDDPWEWHRAEK